MYVSCQEFSRVRRWDWVFSKQGGDWWDWEVWKRCSAWVMRRRIVSKASFAASGLAKMDFCKFRVCSECGKMSGLERWKSEPKRVLCVTRAAKLRTMLCSMTLERGTRPSPSNLIPFFKWVSAISWRPLRYSRNVNSMHVTSTTATSCVSLVLASIGCKAEIAWLYCLRTNFSLVSILWPGIKLHSCAALSAMTACMIAGSEARAGITVACQKGYPNQPDDVHDTRCLYSSR